MIRRSVLILPVCLAAACSPPTAPPPIDAAPPAPVASIALAIDQDASADAASEGGAREPAPDYENDGIRPLDPACNDPRAVLGTALISDPNLMTRIRQALAAHPEFEVVEGVPAAPRRISLSRSGYGTKYFSTPERNRYAVIARCADAGGCRDLAAMIRAVVPGSEPVLVCGEPPAISGGTEALKGPWSGPAALSTPADRVASCARVTACSVRLASAARGTVARECEKAPTMDAYRCARAASCAGVVACWRVRGRP